MKPRTAAITRKTNETDIQLELSLDGGPYTNRTGVGFLDHMLDHVARHGGLGLTVTAAGDTHIDDHHTVEDVGIVLGQALQKALGDKRGIERYGYAVVPMDDAQARVAVDLSGRAALVFRVQWSRSAYYDPMTDTTTVPLSRRVGESIQPFDLLLIKEFFKAVSDNAQMNLHVEVPWGENNHHIAEAIFKAFGRALRQAVRITGDDVPSTKGTL